MDDQHKHDDAATRLLYNDIGLPSSAKTQNEDDTVDAGVEDKGEELSSFHARRLRPRCLERRMTCSHERSQVKRDRDENFSDDEYTDAVEPNTFVRGISFINESGSRSVGGCRLSCLH